MRNLMGWVASGVVFAGVAMACSGSATNDLGDAGGSSSSSKPSASGATSSGVTSSSGSAIATTSSVTSASSGSPASSTGAGASGGGGSTSASTSGSGGGSMCTDGVKDGSETGVDCGGPVCVGCTTGQGCVTSTDCLSLDCQGGQCQAPTCSDGIQNQGETQVDCGGPNCPECAVVYGQSAGTLYKLDPTTKVVTTVGDFVGCDTVIDIALDKSGDMYATTFSGFYKVDPKTAVCTLISFGSYPNSLSFVPAGTLDPNVEALVGYNSASYVRIDLGTGAVSNVGSLGNQGYSSSGDVVSVIGGGTYLTVKGGPSNCSDCIVEVDPKTGALMNLIGPVGHTDVFGLAYWGGAAYGFDNAGELFQIDLSNGNSTTISIPNAPPGLSFYGAGSTTAAPLHM